MAKFFIDFSGYCAIDAETREEAEEKFWKGLQSPSKSAYDDVYDIDGIEEDTTLCRVKEAGMGIVRATKKELIVTRIKLLKQMHEYIINLGDEDIYDQWIQEAVPDEPSEDDFFWIASHDEDWCETCHYFGQLTKGN